LLWAIFAIDWFFGYLVIARNEAIYPVIASFNHVIARHEAIYQLFITVCSYCFMILGINMLIPKLNTDKYAQSLKQTINSMKANEAVFTAILKQQPYYKTNDCNSVIRFGNPHSKLHVTVFSNPYCKPCAKMHIRIEDLLKKVNNDISVQYMLSSFKEDLNSTNKYLIAACLFQNSPRLEGQGWSNEAMQILSDWFEKGKAQKDDYFKNFSLNMENPAIEEEFQKHEAWRQKTQLSATPTILVNGFQLPVSYKIEDIRYFTNLDL
jgi:protein-disulfide isomerase